MTALRTGAVAAVAAQALAPEARHERRHRRRGAPRRLGRPLPDGRGVRRRRVPRPAHGGRHGAGAELGSGWRAGTREEALGCDVVCCVTPGAEPVVGVADLRPGLHLDLLGADGPGKAEATVDAVAACRLFCDEWAQASHGGELTGAVEVGRSRART